MIRVLFASGSLAIGIWQFILVPRPRSVRIRWQCQPAVVCATTRVTRVVSGLVQDLSTTATQMSDIRIPPVRRHGLGANLDTYGGRPSAPPACQHMFTRHRGGPARHRPQHTRAPGTLSSHHRDWQAATVAAPHPPPAYRWTWMLRAHTAAEGRSSTSQLDHDRRDIVTCAAAGLVRSGAQSPSSCSSCQHHRSERLSPPRRCIKRAI